MVRRLRRRQYVHIRVKNRKARLWRTTPMAFIPYQGHRLRFPFYRLTICVQRRRLRHSGGKTDGRANTRQTHFTKRSYSRNYESSLRHGKIQLRKTILLYMYDPASPGPSCTRLERCRLFPHADAPAQMPSRTYGGPAFPRAAPSRTSPEHDD